MNAAAKANRMLTTPPWYLPRLTTQNQDDAALALMGGSRSWSERSLTFQDRRCGHSSASRPGSTLRQRPHGLYSF